MTEQFPAAHNQPLPFANGRIHVSEQPVIPFINGDGCGPEVMLAARQVVDAAVKAAYNSKRAVMWKEVYAGQKAFDLTGYWLPEETLETLKKYHIGIKGPLNTPVGEGIRSLNVALRKELDLYACLRPVKYFAGTPSPLRSPLNIDIVLFRENTEDVYAGIEFDAGSPDTAALLDFMKLHFPNQYTKLRFPDSSALAIKPISRQGSERIIRTAIQWALQNRRKTITLIHKGNIMKFTEGGFLKWGYALAEMEFGDRVYGMRQWKQTAAQSGEEAANRELEQARQAGKLILTDMIADAAFEQAITRPQEMDVLVTTNLNGDYLSDALAALVGGLGVAPGANINFNTGDAIFEATHGTAPSIAGKNIANPCSLILSAVLMLRHLGWDEAADRVDHALQQTLASRNVTADLFAQMDNATLLSTTAFTQQMIQRI